MKMKDLKHIKRFNESVSDVIISQIEKLIDEKMDELIGKGDYTVGYSKDQNRFIVSFRKGDIETSSEMADEVVDYVNIERNILRVGNYGESMFWLTLIDYNGTLK
jgi:hypothetical protein